MQLKKLGALEFTPAAEYPELLAEPVMKSTRTVSRPERIGGAEIDPQYSDTTGFCSHYQVKPEQVANCVVIEAKRAGRQWLAACVILGNTRVDVNNTARRFLKARKASFAPMDKAVSETGMEYGAITPFGLPAYMPLLIDLAVANSEYVIVGSGIRKSKLVAQGSVLANLPNAQVLENLGQ